MSLKYRSSDGTETPVAGLNGTSGELVPSVALMQTGTITDGSSLAVNSAKNLTVTLDTAMPDANYLVTLEQINNFALLKIRNKTATGFTVSVCNIGNETVTISDIKWIACYPMTDTVHEADSAHIAQNTANFAPAFSETTSYAVGDYVTYNNVLYRCTTAHTAGVWVAGHFTQVTVGGEIKTTMGTLASLTHVKACTKDGNLVTLVIDSSDVATITDKASTTIATLPEGFWPNRQIYAPCCIRSAGGWAAADFKSAVLRVYPNGTVAIAVGSNGTVGTGYYISAQVTYNQLVS